MQLSVRRWASVDLPLPGIPIKTNSVCGRSCSCSCSCSADGLSATSCGGRSSTVAEFSLDVAVEEEEEEEEEREEEDDEEEEEVDESITASSAHSLVVSVAV